MKEGKEEKEVERERGGREEERKERNRKREKDNEKKYTCKISFESLLSLLSLSLPAALQQFLQP